MLTAFVVFFGVDTGFYYRSLQRDIDAKELRLAAAGRPADIDALPKTQAQPVSGEEYALARETVRRLSMPWHTLFAALEASQSPGIRLVAIEPETENRTVTVSGEAVDYLAVLAYVANLAEQPVLRDVRLKHHETKSSSGANTVAFAIAAQWEVR